MSSGSGVGNIVAILGLTNRVFIAYKDAPVDGCLISHEQPPSSSVRTSIKLGSQKLHTTERKQDLRNT